MSRRSAAILAVVLLLAGCSAGENGSSRARRTPSASTSASAPDPTALAPAPALPPDRACYRLTFDQALAPVSRAKPRSCDRPHTSRTFFVGSVDDLVPGARAVGSPRVQRAVAAACLDRLSRFLGGPEQALRLSMFRPVWFTPTRGQAATGQAWYRCDVIALAAEGSLAPLEGRLEGLLGRIGWKSRYGLCATAEPGTPDFERVSCARAHSWRALTTVPIQGDRYPGVAAVQALGDEPCTAAARNVADDPLDFRWGYEWPSLEQWRDGRRYGVCWAPESASP